MTTKEIKLSVATAKDLMSGNRDQFREIVRDLLQELLEAEMTETLSAGKSECVFQKFWTPISLNRGQAFR